MNYTLSQLKKMDKKDLIGSVLFMQARADGYREQLDRIMDGRTPVPVEAGKIINQYKKSVGIKHSH